MELVCLTAHSIDLKGNYQLRCPMLQTVKLYLLQVHLQPGIRAVQMELDLRMQTHLVGMDSVSLLHSLRWPVMLQYLSLPYLQEP